MRLDQLYIPYKHWITDLIVSFILKLDLSPNIQCVHVYMQLPYQ